MSPLLRAGAASLTLLAGAVGCGGTDVGNGRARLNLLGYEQAPSSGTNAITLETGVSIDSLHMVVDRVRLQPGTACDGEDGKIDVDRILVADLVGEGILNPRSEREWERISDTFCELRLDFHKLEAGESVPAGTPTELVDRSMRMVGRRQDGVSFVVESDRGERLELEAKDGSFTLPEVEDSLILAFELSRWVDALDLDALPAAAIVVNKDTNQDRLAAFEDAVTASMDLFHDDDGDDKLSPVEHALGRELSE